MTPKEKAQELVDNMGDIPDGGFGSMGRYEAKQCALVAVDEIINNVLVGIDLAATWGDYWVKVKQEIEKL